MPVTAAGSKAATASLTLASASPTPPRSGTGNPSAPAMPSDHGETMKSPASGGSVFATPASPGPGGRRRDESVWQFLERSTDPVATDTRARWDAWLARMPTSARAALVTRLKDRHNELVRSALAELVTFVLLDRVYPAVEIEPETGTGSRTDFAVDVPDADAFRGVPQGPAHGCNRGRPAPCLYCRGTGEDRVAGLLAERRGARPGRRSRRYARCGPRSKGGWHRWTTTSRSSGAIRNSRPAVSGQPGICPDLTPAHSNGPGT